MKGGARGLPQNVAPAPPFEIGHADEHNASDARHARFDMRRINHAVAYSTPEACTNMAESFLNRLCRAEIDSHHPVVGLYESAYAGEMAWRETNRRRSNGEPFVMIVNAAAEHPVSRQLKGYWSREGLATWCPKARHCDVLPVDGGARSRHG